MFEAVGELNLSAAAGADGFERVEQLRRQHVPSDDREIRWGFGGFRLFDHVADAKQTILAAVVRHRFGIHCSVRRNGLVGHFHECHDGCAVEFINIEQLADRRNFGIDHVV